MRRTSSATFNTVQVFVARLRRKIGNDMIETLREVWDAGDPAGLIQ